MSHAEINYFAVLVCAVVPMVIGFLWYGPIFGKTWMSLVGKTEEEIKKDFNPAKTYGLTVIANFIVAYCLSRLFSYVDVSTIGEGLRLAFLCWLGFTASQFFINNLFEDKPIKLLLINVFYHLVVLLVFSVIIVLWK